MNLHRIETNALDLNLTHFWGRQNALLTAGDRTGCNTMTIGWGQAGRLWNLPVCTVYVRPERYTYQFLEAQDYFTLSVLPEKEKKIMGYCGAKSGRDVDKISECGLTVRYGTGDAPFFDEAELVLVCQKMYVQDLDLSGGLSDAISPFYTPDQGGVHRAYTGLIVEAYTR